jgi:tRNA (mo5U34)-methyltransferase
LSALTLSQQVAEVPFWWHSIDVGEGVVTPGHASPEDQQYTLQSARFPEDLSGKSVLDIGAYDGFYSFEAESRGAQRVVALDHYVWERDISKIITYWKDCSERGVPTNPADTERYIDAVNLPGKLPFNTAHRLLKSRVESVVVDFMEADLAKLGSFDVVLYLGVLYHMENPLAALRRVAQVTKELAIIGTQGIAIEGHEGRSLFEFFPGSELNNDYSNWWAPTEKALVGLCTAAGFSRVEVLEGEPRKEFRPVKKSLLRKARTAAGHALREFGLREPLPVSKPELVRYGLKAHAWK